MGVLLKRAVAMFRGMGGNSCSDGATAIDVGVVRAPV